MQGRIGFEMTHKDRVTPINGKKRQRHLRLWFVHVQRSAINVTMRKSEFQVKETKKIEENQI